MPGTFHFESSRRTSFQICVAHGGEYTNTELRKLGDSVTVVELGLKRGKVPWVPITPTPDPGITERLIQGARSIACINLGWLIVQFQFRLSSPRRRFEAGYIASGKLRNDYSLSPAGNLASRRLPFSLLFAVFFLFSLFLVV
mgnify:CR=1 FL=1